MASEPKNAIAEAIATDLFTRGNKEVAARLVLQDSDERDLGGWCYQAVVDVIAKHLAAVKFPQPAVTCEQVLACLGKVPLHSEDDHGWDIVRRCERHVKDFFASAATPAVEPDMIACITDDEASRLIDLPPEDEPAPPSPAEVKWPTEPGAWERNGRVFVFSRMHGGDMTLGHGLDVMGYSFNIVPCEPNFLGGWRRVPAAADVDLAAENEKSLLRQLRIANTLFAKVEVELSASQQECERLRSQNAEFVDMFNRIDRVVDSREYASRLNQLQAVRDAMSHCPDSEMADQCDAALKANADLTARIAALEAENAELRRKVDAWDRLYEGSGERSYLRQNMDSLLAPAAEGGGA